MFLRIARLVPLTGILFAVLVVAAGLVSGGSPGPDDSAATGTSYDADAGNRDKDAISLILIGLAGLCFLQFLGSVRGALARAEGEPARITTAAVVSGAAFITLAVAAHAFGTVLSWTTDIADSGEFRVDPDTGRVLATLSYLFLVLALFAAAGMALAVATVAFQFRAFPAWLAWFSGLATLAGLLGVLFFPAFVVLVWIVALSAYLFLAPRQAAAEPATT